MDIAALQETRLVECGSLREQNAGPVNSMNAPTFTSSSDDKNKLYDQLDPSIGRIPSTEGLYVIGDINGQRLLELWCYHDEHLLPHQTMP